MYLFNIFQIKFMKIYCIQLQCYTIKIIMHASFVYKFLRYKV